MDRSGSRQRPHVYRFLQAAAPDRRAIAETDASAGTVHRGADCGPQSLSGLPADPDGSGAGGRGTRPAHGSRIRRADQVVTGKQVEPAPALERRAAARSGCCLFCARAPECPMTSMPGGGEHIFVAERRSAHHSNSSRSAALLLVAAATFAVPAPARAQGTAAISGTVKDTTGAVLPGVTVEAASPAL